MASGGHGGHGGHGGDGGLGGLVGSDDLLDFFDLGKKFEKVALIGGQSKGRLK